jgi:hypothetical protein
MRAERRAYDVTNTATLVRKKGIGHADEAVGRRHDLLNVARDSHGDQVKAADAAIDWIEGDPARARKRLFISVEHGGQPNTFILMLVARFGPGKRDVEKRHSDLDLTG